jgi:hypothetical protein
MTRAALARQRMIGRLGIDRPIGLHAKLAALAEELS